MASYIDELFESVIKKVEKKRKVVKSNDKNVVLTEAKMSEIPHEIDDVIHSLAQSRIDMEHLRKTWEAAGFQDLTPLDDILKGLSDLTVLVYEKGVMLADQQIGSKAPEINSQQTPNAVIATAKEEVNNDEALKEDDGADQDEAEGSEDVEAELADGEASLEQAEEEANSLDAIDLPEDPESINVGSMTEGKEISLAECEALCANPANASLRKAFKKCCSDFRHNRPEGSNGEIVKIILTPRNNLCLQFDGCERPAFAYCDGESLI